MNSRKLCIILFFFVLMNFCLCSVGKAQQPAERITVFTAIAPYAYFIEQIGGGAINVETLVGSGKDPHTFEPTPSQISKLSSARAYFKVGMPFEEKLVEKMASLFPNLKIVDLNSGIVLREMESGSQDQIHDHASSVHNSGKTDSQHEHKHVGSSSQGTDVKTGEVRHDHGALDPHVWLSPRNVKIIASNIEKTLVEIDPSQANLFGKNTQVFHNKLDLLDSRLGETFSSLKGKSFYVYHPAFGYLADNYGLHQKAVEIQGKEPTAKQLARLIDAAKKEGVKVIFVAPQFSRKGADTVARGIGGVVVEIDPLERDYLSNMLKISDEIGSGVK